jgi:membrane-associated protease RseP (regulator of RpoE activity)
LTPPPVTPWNDGPLEREYSPATLTWVPVREPAPSAWTAWGRHVALFALTAASVVLAYPESGDVTRASPGAYVGGLKLAAALLSILFAHEMGHYLACRYHGVDATLPFFLPSPWIPAFGLALPWMPLSFVGTFGAVIRIRSPFPNRRALFDIGIAGPIAGFVVCMPMLVLGVLATRFVPSSPGATRMGLSLGEPLLFQWAFTALKGPVPPGMTAFLGPVGLAAWFGLLVTALNLIPIGQLDGGHVTYALFGNRAVALSRLVWWASVAMIVFIGPQWILWSGLVRLLGIRHPRTLDDDQPVGMGRVLVGVLGLAILVVSFLPNPFFLTWKDFLEAIRGVLGLAA